MSGIRIKLLSYVDEFVQNVSQLEGVSRIALVGSLTTNGPNPKDADVLVTIDENVDMDRLAKYSRRLQGQGQGLNSGADIFLCNSDDEYLGRTCHYWDCHFRVSCDGRQCRPGNRICTDLHVLKLKETLIKNPPIELWPEVVRRVTVPQDVERILLKLRDREGHGNF